MIIVLTLLPSGFFGRRWGRWGMHALVFAVIFLLLFDLGAEWIF
ncbi:MAG TPA: hypothetical protein PK653_03270 [Syntrophales bacterium]|nr:hypothetical protein [Syntrophales bacterium]